MSGLFMTVEGVVGTEPRLVDWKGTPVLGFRMVSHQRRYDTVTQGWVDVHSSWFSVSCFRMLARNTAESVRKGDRLIVHGKVRVRDYVSDDGQRRTSVNIEATAIGHDLKFGIARFRPAAGPENADERLREQAEELIKQMADLPQENIERVLAERATLAASAVDVDETEPDDFDGENEGDEADEEVEDDALGPRRPSLAGAGR